MLCLTNYILILFHHLHQQLIFHNDDDTPHTDYHTHDRLVDNISSLGTTTHLHDQHIDKLTSLNIVDSDKILQSCLPCNLSSERQHHYITKASNKQLHDIFSLQDKIYTQQYQPKTPPIHAICMLMDLGANLSATCYQHLLRNYATISPKTIGGANKDSGSITVLGFGYLEWYTSSGQLLLVKCYYSPDLGETIVSPTNVVLNQFLNIMALELRPMYQL